MKAGSNSTTSDCSLRNTLGEMLPTKANMELQRNRNPLPSLHFYGSTATYSWRTSNGSLVTYIYIYIIIYSGDFGAIKHGCGRTSLAAHAAWLSRTPGGSCHWTQGIGYIVCGWLDGPIGWFLICRLSERTLVPGHAIQCR